MGDNLVKNALITFKGFTKAHGTLDDKFIDAVYADALIQLEELKEKATAYDTKEVQEIIECDRIKRVLINKGFIIKTTQDNKRIVMLVYNELKTKSGALEGKSEIEALTKVLEWVEGEIK